MSNDTFCMKCHHTVPVETYMNSATCPHCGASFSKTHAGCAIWMSGLFLAGIWAAYWKVGQAGDVRVCVWLSLGVLAC
jgi:hypothetical protein